MCDCYCMYNYYVIGYECMTVSGDILSCPLLAQSSLMAQVKLIGSSVCYLNNGWQWSKKVFCKQLYYKYVTQHETTGYSISN